MRIPGWAWDMAHGAIWGFAVAAAASAFVLAGGCHRSWGASGQAIEEGARFGTRGPGGRQDDGGGVVESLGCKGGNEDVEFGKLVRSPLREKPAAAARAGLGNSLPASDGVEQPDALLPYLKVPAFLCEERRGVEVGEHPVEKLRGPHYPEFKGWLARHLVVPIRMIPDNATAQEGIDKVKDLTVIGPEPDDETATRDVAARSAPRLRPQYERTLAVHESAQVRGEVPAVDGCREGRDGRRMSGSHGVFLFRQECVVARTGRGLTTPGRSASL
jgi:hypothetical protein